MQKLMIVVAVLGFAVAAQADVTAPQVQAANFISDLQPNVTLTFDKFNPALGTLIDVTIKLQHSGSAQISADNDDPFQGSNANARIIRSWAVSGPDLDVAGAKTVVGPVVALSADNGDLGMFDSSGPDGHAFSTLSFSNVNAGTYNPLSSLYVGPGTVDLLVDVDTMVNDLQFSATDQYQTEVTNPTLQVKLTVTYTYEPVPEPATLSLLSLGLVLVRRRRA